MIRKSNVNIYGNGFNRSWSRPIYGCAVPYNNGSNACTGCEPNVPFTTTLGDLLTVLTSLTNAIEQFFPSQDITTPLTGKMAVRGSLNIFVYTRIQWVKMYKSIYGSFDANDPVQINLLKDIFLSLGYDWRIDSWLVDRTNIISCHSRTDTDNSNNQP